MVFPTITLESSTYCTRWLIRPKASRFPLPLPPADHPLVTSVGGTVLQTSGPGGAWISETTWPGSGGGYSPWGGNPQFAIPWWQAGMDYTASKGSTTVRNAPDVSIVAQSIS